MWQCGGDGIEEGGSIEVEKAVSRDEAVFVEQAISAAVLSRRVAVGYEGEVEVVTAQREDEERGQDRGRTISWGGRLNLLRCPQVGSLLGCQHDRCVGTGSDVWICGAANVGRTDFGRREKAIRLRWDWPDISSFSSECRLHKYAVRLLECCGETCGQLMVGDVAVLITLKNTTLRHAWNNLLPSTQF